MRLINTATLELEEYEGANIPPYAILSHTWEKDEVNFEDMISKTPEIRSRNGYKKIEKTCEVARKDNFRYAWVDTCCIDKRSSAELTEAINSMFQWYQKSEVCYAYMVDLTDGDVVETSLQLCRWFTRGWTLQELIAPENLVFLNGLWRKKGTKRDHSFALSRATGIPSSILNLNSLKNIEEVLKGISVATRMSWASERKTTRVEDTAYCLLGLFGVHMPLLYGEGSNAFRRLQEEIAKRTTDASLLAWESQLGYSTYLGAFAPSVQCFQNMKLVFPPKAEFTVTSMGLKIQTQQSLAIRSISYGSHPVSYAIPLGESQTTGQDHYLVILRLSPDRFVRSALKVGYLPRGRDFMGVSLYLELDPIEVSVKYELLQMSGWIKYGLQSDINLISVIPTLNCELSNQTITPGIRSAMILSFGSNSSAIMFIVVNFDWRWLNHIYIAEYLSPAAQHILSCLNHLTKGDLEQIWNLSPGAFTRRESYDTNVHEIRVVDGVLTVNFRGNRGDFNWDTDKVQEFLISYSFQSERDK